MHITYYKTQQKNGKYMYSQLCETSKMELRKLFVQWASS